MHNQIWPNIIRQRTNNTTELNTMYVEKTTKTNMSMKKKINES